jgi:DNA-binding GntR family transcriptional regulator
MATARKPQARRGVFRSQKDRVYQSLRKEILTLALTPRQMLIEAELARRFRVSKTPIREALAVLQRDGLVEALPRKGYLVTPITMRDVQNLLELRVALEGMAAELAASRLTPDDLVRLEALRAPNNVGPPDGMQRFLDYNREFHLTIARASGNSRLAALIEQVNEEMSRMIAASYQIGEHGVVIDALRTGDPQRARTAMVEHIVSSQGRALKREIVDFSPVP